MSKQKVLHWFGIRKFDPDGKYSKELPEHLSADLDITERKDMKEYYCKLCGYGYPYASLHGIRMHALQVHDGQTGEFRLG